MADLADTIRNIPLFSGLSREDVAKIMGNLVEVEFSAGATIFCQGERGDALYLIQSGAVQVTLRLAEGRTETIAVLGPQEYFGEMALLSSAPRSANVTTVKDAVLWKLSRESWDDLITKHPSWLLHFCATLSQRLSLMDRQYSQGRDAFNGLAEDFYSRRPAEEQSFYRRAALLARLDTRLAGVLLETARAGEYLATLANSQLALLRPVENGYELHEFFKQFLIEKLLEIEGLDGKTKLHLRFAEIYERENDREQAVHQRLEAKDWRSASRLISAYHRELSEPSASLIKISVERMTTDYLYGDLALLHAYTDALKFLGDGAAAVRCYNDALAQRKAIFNAATVERYQIAAQQLVEQEEFAQALTYLRSTLELAAQKESAQANQSTPSDVERSISEQKGRALLDPTSARRSWRRRLLACYEGQPFTRWLGGLIGLLVWAYFWFIKPDIGLAPAATQQLGLLLLTFIYWVFWVFPDYGVALLLSLGFILSGFAAPEVVLSGFASSTWFMTLGVLGLGAAITSTGLFYRFSLRLVRYFPLKYNWQIFALGIMGVLVMALIPQQSARTAIISQMLVNLSESLGYKNPSKASTGLFVASFLGLGQLGFLFLTGSTTSLIAWGLLPAAVRAEFTWGHWLLAAMVPTLVVVVIMLIATVLLYQPESQAKISYKMVQTQLEILGSLSKYEWVTLAVLCLTVIGWLTVGYHKIDGAWIALLAICILINSGVLGWGMLKKGVDWEMLIYMGATLSIPTLLTQAKIDTWMVGLISPVILPFTQTPVMTLLIIALMTYLVKIVFTSFLTVVTLCIALLPLAGQLHMNPWVIIMTVLIASEVWFFPFQVDWHTLALTSSDGKGFSYRLMNRINPIYALAYLIALVAAVPYWRFLGLVR